MMGMLELVPESWFSWNFDVLQDGRTVAEIDISRWRKKGVLQVDGTNYDVYREGFMRGLFILELNGTRVASAEKPSAMARLFNVESGGRTWKWEGQVFRRTFVLKENDRTIGSLAPVAMVTRKATAEFPGDVPLPVRVFMIWLALLMWKQEAGNSVTHFA
jgi:hypothetical protein